MALLLKNEHRNSVSQAISRPEGRNAGSGKGSA